MHTDLSENRKMHIKKFGLNYKSPDLLSDFRETQSLFHRPNLKFSFFSLLEALGPSPDHNLMTSTALIKLNGSSFVIVF